MKYAVAVLLFVFVVPCQAGDLFKTPLGIAVIDRVGVDKQSMATKLDAAYRDVQVCSESLPWHGLVAVILVHHLNGLYGMHSGRGIYSVVYVEVQDSEAKTAHIAKHEFLHHHLYMMTHDGNAKHDSPLWVRCVGENYSSLEGVK